MTQQVFNRFADAIQQSGVDVVPRVVVSGGNGEDGGSTANVMEGLLTILLSDRFGALDTEAKQKPRSPEAEALRAQIKQEIQKKAIQEEKGKGKK